MSGGHYTPAGFAKTSDGTPGQAQLDDSGNLKVNVVAGGVGGGVMTVNDGGDVAQGTTTDPAWTSGAGTVISLLKKLASGGGGSAVTIADGSDVAQGTTSDPAWVSGSGTVIALLKKIASAGGSAVSIADGSDVAQGTTTDLSSANTVIGLLKNLKAALAGALPLPTGASTSALQTTGNTSLSSIDTKLTSPLTTIPSPISTSGTITASGQNVTIALGKQMGTVLINTNLGDTSSIAGTITYQGSNNGTVWYPWPVKQSSFEVGPGSGDPQYVVSSSTYPDQQGIYIAQVTGLHSFRVLSSGWSGAPATIGFDALPLTLPPAYTTIGGQGTTALLNPVKVNGTNGAMRVTLWPDSNAGLSPDNAGLHTRIFDTTGNRAAEVKAASTAAVAADTALVVAVSPNNTPVLPTGASTSALQTTGNTSLASIDTKTPALGQTTMAASRPVTLASDQTDLLTAQGTTVRSTATWNSGTAINTALTLSATGYPTVVIDLVPSSITGGTLIFQGTRDGSTWSAIEAFPTTAAGTGIAGVTPTAIASYRVNASGLSGVRVRVQFALTGAGSLVVGIAGSAAPFAYGTVAVTGTASINLSQVGGTTFTLGQQLASASLPVVLTAAQLTTLTPLSTVAVTSAGLTNLDVALSTRTKPSDQQHTIIDSGTTVVTQATGTNLHVVVDTAPTTAVTGPLTDTQLRASAVPISGTVTTSPPANATTDVAKFGGTSVTIGQQLAAASIPVILPSATITTLTPPAAITGYALEAGHLATIDSVQGTQGDSAWVSGNGTVVALLKKIASAGGSAVSIADGADVAQGTTTDLSSASTVIGLLKNLKAALAGTLAVSGTVTANAGTNLNTSALALDATLTGGTQQSKITDGTNVATVKAASTLPAATDKALVVTLRESLSTPVTGTVTTTPPANASTNLAQVSGTTADVNSGTKSAGTLRVVLATDQPALTNKLLVTPDSVALPANQSVNVSQVNAVTVLTGTGATGTGAQRVTVATDSATVAGSASLPTGANVIGALTANQSVNLTQLGGVTISTGNGVPDTGTARVFSAQRRTYSASTASKTATAAGTAPFFSISGSGTQTIRVQKILISGTVLSASVYGDIVLKKTSSATSGGTATALTRAPHDSNSAAATAVVNFYTVLATAGTSVGVVAAQSSVFPATGTVSSSMANLSFLDMNRDPVEAIVLRGTAQCLEMSFGTTTTNAPTLSVSVTWTEE